MARIVGVGLDVFAGVNVDNLLAAWPACRAARLRTGQILHTE